MGKVIEVKVKPHSRCQELEEKDGMLIVSLRSKPENGEANKELVELLSKHFGTDVKLIRGLKGKRKTVLLS